MIANRLLAYIYFFNWMTKWQSNEIIGLQFCHSLYPLSNGLHIFDLYSSGYYTRKRLTHRVVLYTGDIDSPASLLRIWPLGLTGYYTPEKLTRRSFIPRIEWLAGGCKTPARYWKVRINQRKYFRPLVGTIYDNKLEVEQLVGLSLWTTFIIVGALRSTFTQSWALATNNATTWSCCFNSFLTPTAKVFSFCMSRCRIVVVTTQTLSFAYCSSVSTYND